jgi:RNA polymerase sigma factor (sigma-70 family)
MTPTSMAALVRHLRKIINPSVDASVSDAELLERFVHRRDEAAFELLVWRHQWLVLGVCRRLLGDVHDAEDAFQATFLALARKAVAVGRGDAVAGWLHTVAFRIALRIRASAQRMKTNVDLAAIESRANPAEEAERRDLAAVLDEEISRLPRKYRTAVVLCYLEGKSYAEAARQLGVAAGTLAGRLMRARELLRKRLLRRGIGISGALLAAVLGEQSSLAAAPASLVNAIVKTAASLLLGETATKGAISSTVATLTEEALRSMILTKIKTGMVALLAGLLVTGMGLLIPAAIVSPAIETESPVADAPPSHSERKSVRVDDYGDPLPGGALRRVGTLRFRHGGGIENLLLTPDGKTLVSNDYYGTRTVCVWELATGRLRHRFPGTYEAKNIALSPDGKIVAISQEKAIVLWDLVSGKEVRRLAHPDATGFAFSPDGKTLAASGHDPDIQIWDLTTCKRFAKFTRDLRDISVSELAFTPDGRTLIAGQKFHSEIGLWDVTSGKKRQLLDTQSGAIFTLALSPDGTLLATGSRKGGIPLWNPKTGELVRKLGKDGERQCYHVAFSPDAKTLAAIERDAKNQDSLSLWDLASGKEMRRFEGSIGLWGLAYSRDGKTLIAATSGAIRLLDAATGKEIGLTAGSPSFVCFASTSPDGRTLAYLRNNDIRFWDMKSGREIGSIDAHNNGIRSLALAPDGRTVAASGGEHDINLWDVKTCKLLRRLQWDKKESPHSWSSEVVAFSSDGRMLASGDYPTSIVRIWEADSGKLVRRLPFSENTKELSTIESIAFSPDGKTLAVSGRGKLDNSKVRLWDVATGKQITHLIARLNDPSDTGPPQPSRLPHGPIVEPKILFSPDGWMLAMNRWQKAIPVWESATSRQRFLLKGHEESTVCVAFAPDGRTLASASWDESIRLWDLDNGRELRKLTGHRGKANSLAFSTDGKILVSAGDDTTILFWDVADITGRKRPQMGRLAAEDWQALWEELAKDDAAKAYAAMVRMVSGGPTTTAALKERLRPVRPADAERLARLFKGVDSDEFAVRESANRELEKLGDVILPAVRQRLARPGLSLELRRRLEALSSSLDETSGERLCQLRAIEVLEMLGTTEARELLQAMAGGAPEASVTTAAQLALKRLQR